MTIWQTYCVWASIVTFLYLLLFPTKLSQTDNIFASAIVALLLGWVVWPFIVVIYHVRQYRGDLNND